ncbi:MAG: T9SS type A sorting domain-containing protein, partial [Rhodothermales bacterium]
GVWRSGHVGTNFIQRFGSVVPPAHTDFALSIVVNTFSEENHIGDGDVFVGTDGNGVFVSKNDGALWSNIGTTGPGPLPPAARIVRTLEIDRDGAGTNVDRLYIGTHGAGVWYVNYGAGSKAPTGTSPWVRYNGSDGILNNVVVHGLALDESTSRLYAATDVGLYYRDPHHDTWHISLDGAIARDVVIYECAGTKYVLVATDGAFVYRSEDNGSNWSQFQGHSAVHVSASGFRGSTIISLMYADSYVFAGTQDYGVHRSDDCGRTWNQISHGEVVAAIQDMVFDPESDRIYAGTFGYGVLVSSVLHQSSTLSWTRINRGLTNQWVYAMERAAPAIIAGTWGGGIFRTTDHGENWFFMGLEGRIVYDVLYNPFTRVLYAATDRGEVARSVDRGISWHEFGVATTAIWSMGLGETPSTLYVGTFGAGIYKSTDEGRTFLKTGLQFGHVFDFTYGINPKTGKSAVFAATSIGVKYSEDGGVTWHSLNDGLTVTDVRSIIFAGFELVCGTWGGGAYVYDPIARAWVRDGLPAQNILAFVLFEGGDELFVSTESGVFRKQVDLTTTPAVADAELPDDYTLQQNYPNPFNPSTEISFALPIAGDIRLVVYDGLGRPVDVLASGSFPAGSHTVRFDASALASGIYVYRLETRERILSRKMLVMK